MYNTVKKINTWVVKGKACLFDDIWSGFCGCVCV